MRKNLGRKKENGATITVLLNENGSHKYEFERTEWLNSQGGSCIEGSYI